jgi:hypothetical protein
MPPHAITENTLFYGDNLPILRDYIASASEQQRRRTGDWTCERLALDGHSLARLAQEDR